MPRTNTPRTIPKDPIVDRQHPLADRLIGCWLPAVTGGSNLAGNGMPTLVPAAGAALLTSRDGPITASKGSGFKGWTAKVGTATDFTNWTEFTLFARAIIYAGVADQYPALFSVLHNDFDGNPYHVAGIVAQPDWQWTEAFFNSGGTLNQTSTVNTYNFITVGEPFSIAATFKVGGNVILYINGVSQASIGFGASAPQGSGTSTVTINGSLNRGSNSGINCAFAFKRALSPAEILALSIDPYAFIQSRTRRRVGITAGGPTNYTMAAGLGTLTAAGQPAILRITRGATAGLGTLTAAGQPAVLRATRKVAAGLGTLTLSGQPATLTYSRKIKMVAGLGVLTPSGQAINLTYSGAGSKTMLAGLGTITLSGQPVTLRYARKMPAGLGTITLSGQPATLAYSRKLRMAADLGTITLSGQSAILRYARKMPAGLGTLTLSGQPVTLTYSRKIKMAAGLGTITIDGKAATLTKASSSARVLAAGLGTLTLGGQPVTLRYAHKMAAGLGTVTLGGQPAGLRRAKNLTALVGNINLTGQAAGLTYTHSANIRMVAGPGTLVLAGQSVGLTRVSTLAGQPGVLNFGRRVTINRW